MGCSGGLAQVGLVGAGDAGCIIADTVVAVMVASIIVNVVRVEVAGDGITAVDSKRVRREIAMSRSIREPL